MSITNKLFNALLVSGAKEADPPPWRIWEGRRFGGAPIQKPTSLEFCLSLVLAALVAAGDSSSPSQTLSRLVWSDYRR